MPLEYPIYLTLAIPSHGHRQCKVNLSGNKGNCILSAAPPLIKYNFQPLDFGSTNNGQHKWTNAEKSFYKTDSSHDTFIDAKLELGLVWSWQFPIKWDITVITDDISGQVSSVDIEAIKMSEAGAGDAKAFVKRWKYKNYISLHCHCWQCHQTISSVSLLPLAVFVFVSRSRIEIVKMSNSNSQFYLRRSGRLGGRGGEALERI